MFWAARENINDEWAWEIKHWLNRHAGPRFWTVLDDRRTIRYARVTITYFFPTRHRRDPDNYTPKCIMDALKGQIIEDDRGELIILEISRFQYDKDNPRTEIEIEELPSPDGS